MGEIKNMKKKYIKPTVMFEKIVFDTAIAACTFVEGNWVAVSSESSQTCERQIHFTEDNAVYVLADTSVCDDGAFYCYHVPDGRLAIGLQGS